MERKLAKATAPRASIFLRIPPVPMPRAPKPVTAGCKPNPSARNPARPRLRPPRAWSRAPRRRCDRACLSKTARWKHWASAPRREQAPRQIGPLGIDAKRARGRAPPHRGPTIVRSCLMRGPRTECSISGAPSGHLAGPQAGRETGTHRRRRAAAPRSAWWPHSSWPCHRP